ncbi:MAG: helix-turn-helix domain-containing protein [Pirellulaceae bacterium]
MTAPNPQLELAFDFVRHTHKNLYLTGKAGSGKTTFLHRVKAEVSKRMAVVAPTGVAAINAGGMTIHSLFQLPFGVFIPGSSRAGQEGQHRFSRKKMNILRSLELLVIDEISMVRADLLDAIDDVLRRIRHSSRPFGGVQLLMIGDLHQLPPVAKPNEWSLLSPHYETPYFFSSQAIQRTDYQSIELKHIYRQSDPAFVSLLNQVRDNCVDAAALRTLNSRYVPDFKPSMADAYITLTATNAVANQINSRNLQLLPGEKHRFRAQIKGEFPESSWPTEECLEFKKDAQVMFIKNDLQQERRYFNGKIGHIKELTNDSIIVRCPGEEIDIEVVPDEWQNVRYSFNEESKQIEEQILGTFTQYPIRLAWAITIHKSQGLTFDRAIIDAQAAFASGQVYVALSRCKTFEGIVLRSPILSSSVKTDPLVVSFTQAAEDNTPTQSQLTDARREFQMSAIKDLFEFRGIQIQLNQLLSRWAQHASSLPTPSEEQLQAAAAVIRSELLAVADKFAPQLVDYLGQPEMPESNEALQTRICKASGYFVEKITLILESISSVAIDSDNQQVSSAITDKMNGLRLALSVKQCCFAGCRNGFSTDEFHRNRINAELDFLKTQASRSFKKVVVPRDISYPELYRQLFDWREQTAEQNGKSPNDVLPRATLRELVLQLPASTNQLRNVSGIGKTRLRQYGDDIIKLIENFCIEKQVPQNDGPAAQVQSKTSETKRVSFDMFRDGKGIDAIAAERGLVRSTIEGHLAHFVLLGELSIGEVLDNQTIDEIQQFLLEHPSATASEAKSHFGEKYGYGEFKLVMSHAQSLAPPNP